MPPAPVPGPGVLQGQVQGQAVAAAAALDDVTSLFPCDHALDDVDDVMSVLTDDVMSVLTLDNVTSVFDDAVLRSEAPEKHKSSKPLRPLSIHAWEAGKSEKAGGKDREGGGGGGVSCGGGGNGGSGQGTRVAPGLGLSGGNVLLRQKDRAHTPAVFRI